MKHIQLITLLFLTSIFSACGEPQDDKGSNNGDQNNGNDNNGSDNNGNDNNGSDNNGNDNNGNDNNGEDDDGIGAECNNKNDCDSQYCKEPAGSTGGKCAVNDFGKNCKVGDGGSDCEYGICVIKSDGDVFGYCTDVCDSFSDCPTFWECEELGNASGRFCLDK